MDKKQSIKSIVATLDQGNIDILNMLIVSLGDVESAVEGMISGHFIDGGSDWVQSDEDLEIVLETIADDDEAFVKEMDNKFNNINW